jgi:hypothetical protein
MRRASSPFPFADLPADVQLLILSNVDLPTLKAMTESVPSARDLYLEYPSSVLHSATATRGLQVRNILLTTASLVSTIRAVGMYSKPDLEDMDRFLAESLDTETPKKMELLEYDPLGALSTLCEIDAEIVSFVHSYAEDIYEKACSRDNPEAIPPPLVLSTAEHHRITRAVYLLKLFGVLFYDYADRFHLDLEPCYPAFITRLSTFEIDEVVAIYQFALRKSHYFQPAYVHTRCLEDRIKMWDNLDPLNCDPLNCETCRGRYNNTHMKEGVEEPRTPHPFWYTVHEFFLARHVPWADPKLCTPSPIKTWRDFPGAAQPTKGWLWWREYHDGSAARVMGKTYVGAFRTLGYCFWDAARLEGWGNMFSAEWVQQQREKNNGVLCNHSHLVGCRGSCS